MIYSTGWVYPVSVHGMSASESVFPGPTCNRTCWSHLSLRASSSCFRRASTSSIFLAAAFFLAFSANRSSLACRIHSHCSLEQPLTQNTEWDSGLCDKHPSSTTNPACCSSPGKRHKKSYLPKTAHSQRDAGKLRSDFQHLTCLRDSRAHVTESRGTQVTQWMTWRGV